MKDNLISIGWILLSILLMGWVTYQSWHWFFTEKSPVVRALSVSNETPPTIHVENNKPSYIAPFQNEGNLVQKTINGNKLQ